MRLQHLHLLLTIAHTGSLRASAETLNVTQPALTKALKQLEEEFGTTLVIRSPKGVRLAPAGELLAARAATVVREIDRAREEVEWLTRHAQATVTVGVSPAAALMLAPQAVSRFQSRWPQVRVRLVDALYPTALAQLRSGELDLALGPLPATGLGRDLEARALIDSPEVIAARAGHPLAKSRQLADLADANWVLTGPTQGPGDPAHLQMEKLGLPPPRITLECESFSTLLAVLPRMDAVALMPRRFFESHGPRIGLVVLPIAEALPLTTIHLFLRTDSPLTVPTQRLMDAFVSEAQALRRARN
ncbi:LysR substrate-binding domain-containing protein [Variovorax ureilyticus]|uniref:LysR substrate-binding domain-containing protein n=1 Tax=Variovorax ureilyticus TaxID=1836198 RepID=A0ABU8VDX7_9BURK